MIYILIQTIYKILFHPYVENEYQTDFSFLTEKLYEESPVYREHKLAFEKAVEYGGYEDFRFDMDFNGESYYEYQEKLTDEQKTEMDNILDGTGHKIGGYAFFTQSDPRDYNNNQKDEILLLQIGENGFNDEGVFSVTIPREDLKKLNFDNCEFAWGQS